MDTKCVGNEDFILAFRIANDKISHFHDPYLLQYMLVNAITPPPASQA
jgi:hypothetical protein